MSARDRRAARQAASDETKEPETAQSEAHTVNPVEQPETAACPPVASAAEPPKIGGVMRLTIPISPLSLARMQAEFCRLFDRLPVTLDELVDVGVLALPLGLDAMELQHVRDRDASSEAESKRIDAVRSAFAELAKR